VCVVVVAVVVVVVVVAVVVVVVVVRLAMGFNVSVLECLLAAAGALTGCWCALPTTAKQ